MKKQTSKRKSLPMNDKNEELRLPLDLLLVKDVDDLEEALHSKYAIESESEITFCRTDDDLAEMLEDLDFARHYEIDEIEHDRIQAIIDLLNRAELDPVLGHIIDRIVR